MRWRTWLKGLALLAALFGLTVWSMKRAIRQERLDRALIEAVWHLDSNHVATLLAQGADPNAHKRPQKTLTPWQRLLEIFRGKRQAETPYNSALWIATRRDMDWDNFLRHGNTEEVLRALLRAGATRNAVTKQASASLAWAEQKIARIADVPPMRREEETSDYNLKDAAGDLENVVQKYGPSERAYTEIARCWLRCGQIDEARHALHMALLLAPAFLPARQLQTELEQEQTLRREMATWLSRGSEVVRVLTYSADGKKFWLALTAVVSKLEDMAYMEFDAGVRLSVFTNQGDKMRRVWQSPTLTGSNYPNDTIHGLSLWVFDMTGDGQPEIIVQPRVPRASYGDAQMYVYQWRQHRPELILRQIGVESLWLENLQHNGRYVVRNWNWIGSQGPRQDIWSNIYALQNGRYIQANRWFPDQFKEYTRFARVALSQHPHDCVLWGYLAYACDLCGEKAKGARAWKRAARDCLQSIASETDAKSRESMRDNLKAIRAHKPIQKR